MTEVDLYAFLSQCRLGVLGYTSAEGCSQSALVGFAVTRELEIIFDTVSLSRKYPNLLERPNCSLVIGWQEEKTAQYEGRARELKDPERQSYLDVYLAVWPDCQAHLSWPGIAHFVVQPSWIRYSDYNQVPALIAEFKF